MRKNVGSISSNGAGEGKSKRMHRLTPFSTRYAVLISLFITIILSCKESKKTMNPSDKPEYVTTTGYFDTLEAKSGYNINGYWVSLTNEQLQLYKGKKSRSKRKTSCCSGC